MSHLRSPRAMIWPTLRAIEFPPWLATEAHIWSTMGAQNAGYSSLLNDKWLIGRKCNRRVEERASVPESGTLLAHHGYSTKNRLKSRTVSPTDRLKERVPSFRCSI